VNFRYNLSKEGGKTPMYPYAICIWITKNGMSSFIYGVSTVSVLKNKNKFLVGLDMILSNLLFGSTFAEYINLKFYDRTYKNRNTYLTTFNNWINYLKLNNRKQNIFFQDKAKFNVIFKSFLKKDWVDFRSSYTDIYNFLQKHSKVIMKPRMGDSGKVFTL
jgi:hypothetical protein